jgi:hypothetical protein
MSFFIVLPSPQPNTPPQLEIDAKRCSAIMGRQRMKQIVRKSLYRHDSSTPQKRQNCHENQKANKEQTR